MLLRGNHCAVAFQWWIFESRIASCTKQILDYIVERMKLFRNLLSVKTKCLENQNSLIAPSTFHDVVGRIEKMASCEHYHNDNAHDC